jgi:hypothetical protein
LLSLWWWWWWWGGWKGVKVKEGYSVPTPLRHRKCWWPSTTPARVDVHLRKGQEIVRRMEAEEGCDEQINLCMWRWCVNYGHNINYRTLKRYEQDGVSARVCALAEWCLLIIPSNPCTSQQIIGEQLISFANCAHHTHINPATVIPGTSSNNELYVVGFLCPFVDIPRPIRRGQ